MPACFFRVLSDHNPCFGLGSEGRAAVSRDLECVTTHVAVAFDRVLGALFEGDRPPLAARHVKPLPILVDVREHPHEHSVECPEDIVGHRDGALVLVVAALDAVHVDPAALGHDRPEFVLAIRDDPDLRLRRTGGLERETVLTLVVAQRFVTRIRDQVDRPAVAVRRQLQVAVRRDEHVDSVERPGVPAWGVLGPREVRLVRIAPVRGLALGRPHATVLLHDDRLLRVGRGEDYVTRVGLVAAACRRAARGLGRRAGHRAGDRRGRRLCCLHGRLRRNRGLRRRLRRLGLSSEEACHLRSGHWRRLCDRLLAQILDIDGTVLIGAESSRVADLRLLPLAARERNDRYDAKACAHGVFEVDAMQKVLHGVLQTLCVNNPFLNLF